MGKIPFMKLTDMENVKSNAAAYLPHFKEKDNAWLTKALGHNAFGETKFDLPDIQLYMPLEIDGCEIGDRDKSITDKYNVRELYSKLIFLSDSQASEERLWAGLCMGPMWKYVSYRWKIDSANAVKQHYFFGYGPRRSLTRNAVARLWWIGRLTYDSQRDDPFELTDFVCENSRFIVDVLERNVSDSLPLMKEFLSACIDAKKEGLELDTNTIRELEKYMDILGGIYVLDYMPEGFLYNKVLEKAKSLLEVKGIKRSKRQENIEASDTSPLVTERQGTDDRRVGENSLITIEYQNGSRVRIDLGKMKLHTKPKSLVGMKEGSCFRWSGKTVKIIHIE